MFCKEVIQINNLNTNVSYQANCYNSIMYCSRRTHMLMYIIFIQQQNARLNMVPWLQFRTKREPGFEYCAVQSNQGKFVHSSLLQFTQMYE